MIAVARTEPAADRALDAADAMLALFDNAVETLRAAGLEPQMRARLARLLPDAVAPVSSEAHALAIQAALDRITAAHRPSLPAPQPAPPPLDGLALAGVLSELRAHPRTVASDRARATIQTLLAATTNRRS
ncbi:MAG: hypothetical protein ABL901_01080 [Hyphomicrobiaceae bacterium]